MISQLTSNVPCIVSIAIGNQWIHSVHFKDLTSKIQKKIVDLFYFTFCKHPSLSVPSARPSSSSPSFASAFECHLGCQQQETLRGLYRARAPFQQRETWSKRPHCWFPTVEVPAAQKFQCFLWAMCSCYPCPSVSDESSNRKHHSHTPSWCNDWRAGWQFNGPSFNSKYQVLPAAKL